MARLSLAPADTSRFHEVASFYFLTFGESYIAHSGIINGKELDPSAAARYALQDNGATHFMHFRQPAIPYRDLLVAAYKKSFEGFLEADECYPRSQIYDEAVLRISPSVRWA